jgi:uncharacterized protein YfaT (DUF1175 family)
MNLPSLETLKNPALVRAIQGELAGDGNIWGRMQSSVDDSPGVPEWFTHIVSTFKKNGVTPNEVPQKIAGMVRSMEAQDAR